MLFLHSIDDALKMPDSDDRSKDKIKAQDSQEATEHQDRKKETGDARKGVIVGGRDEETEYRQRQGENCKPRPHHRKGCPLLGQYQLNLI